MWRQSYHTNNNPVMSTLSHKTIHPWKAQNTFYIQINWWFDYHLKNERGRIYLPYLIFRSSWSSSIALLSDIEGNFLQLLLWELSLIFAYLPTLYRAISWVFVWKSWLWTDDWMCSDGSRVCSKLLKWAYISFGVKAAWSRCITSSALI
jgi:hypothetical protein